MCGVLWNIDKKLFHAFVAISSVAQKNNWPVGLCEFFSLKERQIKADWSWVEKENHGMR